MRGQVPRVAQLTVETLTPLHVGAAQGGGKAFDDECTGRTVPSEYRPPPERHRTPEFVKLYRTWRDQEGTPYIPGSTLRGCLRTLYAGALDAGHIRDPEAKADEIFGSTEQAGAIALNDLMPNRSVRVSKKPLVRYLPATEAAGRVPGGSAREFEAELLAEGATFIGLALYTGETLLQVLHTIFGHSKTLGNWLRTGSDGRPNPERVIEGSPIENQLFERKQGLWIITWKLGRFAKSYAKALSTKRVLEGGAPHAYYLVDGQVPGWVRVTFDLGAHGAEFRPNEWPKEERG